MKDYIYLDYSATTPIDKEVLDPAAYRWGGVDYYKRFKGNIVRMTYVGRDTSEDWDVYT